MPNMARLWFEPSVSELPVTSRGAESLLRTKLKFHSSPDFGTGLPSNPANGTKKSHVQPSEVAFAFAEYAGGRHEPSMG